MSYYMQVKHMNGAATAKGHEKWIELESFDFGVSRPVTVKPGHVNNREGGIPNIADMVLTKKLDESSPLLLEATCIGEVLGNVVIDACGSSDNSDKYLQYTLNDAVISNYHIHGNSDLDAQEKPEEVLQINFTKVEMKYIPRDSANKPKSPISAGYDLEKVTKI